MMSASGAAQECQPHMHCGSYCTRCFLNEVTSEEDTCVAPPALGIPTHAYPPRSTPPREHRARWGPRLPWATLSARLRRSAPGSSASLQLHPDRAFRFFSIMAAIDSFNDQKLIPHGRSII